MLRTLETLAKRWKQYKYRFVPWIAFNLRKGKVRTVEDGSSDKIIPDSKVEQSLLHFFTGLSRPGEGSIDRIHDPRGQRSEGQEIENFGNKRNAQVPQLCSTSLYWRQTQHKNGCHMGRQNPSHAKTDVYTGVRLLHVLGQRIFTNVLALYCCLKCLHMNIYLRLQIPCKSENDNCKELLEPSCSQLNIVGKNLPLIPDYRRFCTLLDATSSTCQSFTTATLQSISDRVHMAQCRRLNSEGLEVMHSILGFTIERQPSSIAGGGTGVFVTSGTIPAKTVVAMYPGTVYKPWEPILLQSLANPFIFRCLDGTLIDGNDKGISRMVYRSCTQRDRMGPYLTSDLSWLTNAPTNPMAVGQYVNNQNKANEANVAYQEFDVPESFPFQLLKFIPNVFYSSAYQQSDSSKKRLMRTVVLVSLRDIHCGEELFSSYFTIIH